MTYMVQACEGGSVAETIQVRRVNLFGPPAGGPNIFIVSSQLADKREALEQDIADLLCCSTTIWRSFETSFSSAWEILAGLVSPAAVEGQDGFFASTSCSPGEAQGRASAMTLFFVFKSGMDPFDALKQIDQYECGQIPSAVIAALVAAVHGFENGITILQGPPAIFARLMGRLHPVGHGKLSNPPLSDLRYLAQAGKTPLTELPESAFDRAMFLVTLSEACWCPKVRSQLVQTCLSDPLNAETIWHILSTWLTVPVEE